MLLVPLLWTGGAGALPSLGLFGGKQSPDISVEGFKWRSGGAGRRAVFSEITLKNSGNRNYSEITLRARFYTRDDIPMGGVRGTIKDGIKAGETKTFRNVRLGMMNSGMDYVKVGIVSARAAKGEKKSHPLIVTERKWTPSGGGTGVGTLKSITVKNPSAVPYGAVTFHIIQKQGERMLISNKLTMKKIAEANSETVYRDVNPGFFHPSAEEIIVSVVSAHPVSRKHAAVLGHKTAEKTEAGESAERARDDKDEPVPGYDIEIKEFEWGSGIAGGAGIIKRLVLKNRSGTEYKDVTMLVEFLSSRGTPVTSVDFRIKNPPTPGKTTAYKNLVTGIMSVSPDKKSVKISVRSGTPAPRGK